MWKDSKTALSIPELKEWRPLSHPELVLCTGLVRLSPFCSNNDSNKDNIYRKSQYYISKKIV